MRPGRIQLRRTAGIQPRLRQLQRVGLVDDVALGYFELRLLTPKLEAGPSDFRDDRDLRVAQTCLSTLHLRRLGLDPTTNLSEEVQLPGGIETGLVVRR